MNFENSKLFGISRKRDLLIVLRVKSIREIKKTCNCYNLYIRHIIKNNEVERIRLIESITSLRLKKCK